MQAEPSTTDVNHVVEFVFPDDLTGVVIHRQTHRRSRVPWWLCSGVTWAGICLVAVFLALTGLAFWVTLNSHISQFNAGRHSPVDVQSKSATWPVTGVNVLATAAKFYQNPQSSLSDTLACFSPSELAINTTDDPSFNWSKYLATCRNPPRRSEVAIPISRYTIVCNSYRRLKLLEESIKHYTRCANVDQYVVVWSDPQNTPPTEKIASWSMSKQVPVIVEAHGKNSLNNRFAPISRLRTDAVLSIDDDVRIACEDVELAFQVWQDTPTQMVGFMPRAITCASSTTYDYHSGRPMQFVEQYGHRLVLTKFAFIHRQYLELYTNTMPTQILDMIDDYMNCEDLAFAFLVADTTHRGGIFVSARVKYLPSDNAISAKKGHGTKRDSCITALKLAFRNTLPLSLSITKIPSCSTR